MAIFRLQLLKAFWEKMFVLFFIFSSRLLFAPVNGDELVETFFPRSDPLWIFSPLLIQKLE